MEAILKGYIRKFDREGAIEEIEDVKIASIEALTRFLKGNGKPGDMKRQDGSVVENRDSQYREEFSIYDLKDGRELEIC